jgi:hypothetical protein
MGLRKVISSLYSNVKARLTIASNLDISSRRFTLLLISFNCAVFHEQVGIVDPTYLGVQSLILCGVIPAASRVYQFCNRGHSVSNVGDVKLLV